MWTLSRLWPFAVVVLLFVLIKFALDEYNSAQQKVATTEMVVTQQTEVIRDTVQANQARNEVLDPTKFTKYCQCVRATGDTGVCERYLPANTPYNDKTASVCKTR